MKIFLKELGYRIACAVLAVGGIILVFMIGDKFNICLLQSSSAVLVTLIVLGELLFFGIIGYAPAGKL